MGLRQGRRRHKRVAVSLNGFQRGGRRDVVAGDERQSQCSGDPGALSPGAAEDPRRERRALSWHRMHVELAGVERAIQQGENVLNLLGEVRRYRLRLLQDLHGGLQPFEIEQSAQIEWGRDDHAVHLVPHARRPRFFRLLGFVLFGPTLPRPTNTEIDASGIEGIEHAETLDHRDGRGVAQLNRSRTDSNFIGSSRDLPDQHCGCGTGYADEVMLGYPVPAKPPLFGALSQFDGVTQRRRGVATGADRGEVQDRKRGHRLTAAYRLGATGSPSRARSVSPSRYAVRNRPARCRSGTTSSTINGRSVALTAGRNRAPSMPRRCHSSSRSTNSVGLAVKLSASERGSPAPPNETSTSARTFKSVPPAARTSSRMLRTEPSSMGVMNTRSALVAANSYTGPAWANAG